MSATENSSAYFIIRLDKNNNGYEWGIYSSRTLAKAGSDQFLGHDIVLAQVKGKDYNEASKKMQVMVANHVSGKSTLPVFKD